MRHSPYTLERKQIGRAKDAALRTRRRRSEYKLVTSTLELPAVSVGTLIMWMSCVKNVIFFLRAARIQNTMTGNIKSSEGNVSMNSENAITAHTNGPNPRS